MKIPVWFMIYFLGLAMLSLLTAAILGSHYSEPWIFFVNFGLPAIVATIAVRRMDV